MNKLTKREVIDIITSPENLYKDYELLGSLGDIRNNQIRLEQKGIGPSSENKAHLKHLKDTSLEITDGGVFGVFYLDLACAYMLNGSFLESYINAYSALHINRYFSDNEGIAANCLFLSEVSYMLDDYQKSIYWYEEVKKYRSDNEYDEMMTELKEKVALGKGPVPKHNLDAIEPLEVAQTLSNSDDHVRLSEVAIRRLRRKIGLSAKKCRTYIKELSLEELQYIYLYDKEGSQDARFEEIMEANEKYQEEENKDEEYFISEFRGFTNKSTGYSDSQGNEIFEGHIVKFEESLIARVALHVGEWALINAAMSFPFDKETAKHCEILVDEQWYKQAATYEEWVHDGGSMVGGFDLLKDKNDIYSYFDKFGH